MLVIVSNVIAQKNLHEAAFAYSPGVKVNNAKEAYFKLLFNGLKTAL